MSLVKLKALLGKPATWKLVLQAKLQNGSMYLWECEQLPGLFKSSTRQGTVRTVLYEYQGCTAATATALVQALSAKS